MKTLDEVIKAKELCELNCSDEEHCQDCPYAKQDANGDWSFFCHDCEADALHYLKAFRDMEDELNDIRREHIEQMKNPPLDWETLKQMEGKPVWVEYGIGFNQKRWVVIHSFHNTGSFCYVNVSGNYPNTFWQKDMGEDEFWQAYRKERS